MERKEATNSNLYFGVVGFPPTMSLWIGIFRKVCDRLVTLFRLSMARCEYPSRDFWWIFNPYIPFKSLFISRNIVKYAILCCGLCICRYDSISGPNSMHANIGPLNPQALADLEATSRINPEPRLSTAHLGLPLPPLR